MPEKDPGARANRRPARRWLRPVTLLVTGTLVVLSVGWWGAPPSTSDSDGTVRHAAGWHAGPLRPGVAAAAGETTETSWGPMTALDVDFLVRVRLAGLWEIPAGEMAQTHTSDQRVREVGRTLAADHRRLDVEVLAAARKLQVELPAEPTQDQSNWLAEMEAPGTPTSTTSSPTGSGSPTAGSSRWSPRSAPTPATA